MKKSCAFFILATISIGMNSQTLDPTFGNQGMVETPYGQYVESKVNDLLIQPDGKIIVCGTTFVDTYDFMMIRYLPDGTLDNSFGEQGKAFVDFGNLNNYGLSYALQTDGKIVCTGWSETPGYNSVSLARFNPNGTPDVAFGDAGIMHLATGINESYGNDVCIQSDGKIVVVGRGTYAEQGLDLYMARFLPNGLYDTSFGLGGVVENVNYLSGLDSPVVAQQADGKLVVSGMGAADSQQNYCVMRFTESGDLDATFSDDGIVLTYIQGDFNWPQRIMTQPDGKIVVAGYSGPYQDAFMSMIRYNTDGNLDADFADNGVYSHSINTNLDLIEDCILQPDGKILTCGYTVVPNVGYNFIVQRLLVDGTPDASFGSDGILNQTFSNQQSRGAALQLQTDGKLVVAGYSAVPQDYHTAIARYDVGIPASIKSEPFLSSEAFIFPNPVNNEMHIRLNNERGPRQIFIYNAQGDMIESFKMFGQYETVPTHTYSPGLYYLHIISNDGRTSCHKWVKS